MWRSCESTVRPPFPSRNDPALSGRSGRWRGRAVGLAALLVGGTLLLAASLAAQRRPGAEAEAAPLVVLVHGMGRSPLSMIPLALYLERRGYRVLNFGYSSYGPGVSEIGERLSLRLQAVQGTGPVHFVGHSLGNVVIRWLLTHHPPSPLGRVVMLAPPNQGAQVADRTVRWLGWLLRPLTELTTEDTSTVRRLGVLQGVEFAIISGDRDGKVSLAESVLVGARAHAVVASRHTFIMSKPSVMEMVGHFLDTGELPPGGGWTPLPGMTRPAVADTLSVQ